MKESEIIAKELHKPIKRKFQRAKVITYGYNDVWACDLIDMTKFWKHNKGYKYILNIVDCFTRYAWSIPIKNKIANTLINAFDEVIKTGEKPKKLWIDQGGEFVNKKMKAYLQYHNIKIYHTYGEHKASIAERFNRTLKNKIYYYFTKNNTKKWYDILPEIINEYNNTTHSSIKMTPFDATLPENEKRLLKEQSEKYIKPYEHTKFNVGDLVRISMAKRTFEKGYTPKWSKEIFMIIGVRNTYPVPTYNLIDVNGEKIKGSFYDEELQLTQIYEPKFYL